MDDLTGVWVGETQGKATPLHRWIVVQRGHVLTFHTRYSTQLKYARFEGTMAPDGQSFSIITADEVYEVPLTDGDQFMVPMWVCKRKGRDLIPTYSVRFRRRETGILRWLMYPLVQLFAGLPRLMDKIS